MELVIHRLTTSMGGGVFQVDAEIATRAKVAYPDFGGYWGYEYTFVGEISTNNREQGIALTEWFHSRQPITADQLLGITRRITG